MSQAKVDRYKEQKKNRKQEVKKQKRKKAALKVIGVLVCIAIVVWIGFSGYNYHQKNRPIETTQINLDAITSYLNSIAE